MKKFVFVYYGGKSASETPSEEKKEIMDKWMAWFGSMKEKVADMGNPFGPDGMSVSAEGVEGIPDNMWPAKGYTIVQAESMEEATELAKGCPMIVDKEKDANIRVYEALSMS